MSATDTKPRLPRIVTAYTRPVETTGVDRDFDDEVPGELSREWLGLGHGGQMRRSLRGAE